LKRFSDVICAYSIGTLEVRNRARNS